MIGASPLAPAGDDRCGRHPPLPLSWRQTLNLLLKAYGMGPATPAHPNSLQAAQATLMESVAKACSVSPALDMIIAGIAIGGGDHRVRRDSQGWQDRHPRARAGRGRRHLSADRAGSAYFHGRRALVAGATTLLAGAGGVAHAAEEIERLNRKGMLFAAGLITGEALVGVGVAINHRDQRSANRSLCPRRSQFGRWLGFLLLLGFDVDPVSDRTSVTSAATGNAHDNACTRVALKSSGRQGGFSLVL